MNRHRQTIILIGIFVVLFFVLESHTYTYRSYSSGRGFYSRRGDPRTTGALLLVGVAFSILYVFSRGTKLYGSDQSKSKSKSKRDASLIPPNFKTKDPVAFVDLIQDRSSRIVLTILGLQSPTNLPVIRRFCSNEGYRMLLAEFPDSQRIYDAVNVNFARVEQITFQEGLLKAFATVQFIYRKLPDATDLSGALATEQMRITMVHRPSGVAARGTIYANTCAACGAAQITNIAFICTGCGCELNDMTRDWLLDHIHLKRSFTR